jgi:hypothetical protein
VVLAASPASAQVVTPVAVTVSSTFSTYDEANLIDDSGLVAGLHDEDFGNMWMSNTNDVTPTLTFDLGAVYAITAAQIWQYNATSIDLSRGVNGLNILASQDDVTYTPVTSASLTISPGGPIPAQIVSFAATARYVRFVVTSNHGSLSYTGLSEAKFETAAAPAADAIPTLSGWAMVLFSAIIASAAILLIHRKL